MSAILTTSILLGLVSTVASQCTGNDAPACASWVRNGYCSNTNSPMETRKLYCGVACGFCFANGTATVTGGGATVACSDNNPNCAAWAATGFCSNVAHSTAMKNQYCCRTCAAATAAGGGPTVACSDNNPNCAAWASAGFCTNTAYSMAMKNQYCCRTCASAASTTHPTTTCGVIYMGATIVANSAPTMIPQLLLNPSPLTRVYVKTGCSLKLYLDPMIPPTQATGSPFTGADAFITLTGTAASTTGAPPGFLTYECTCP